METVVKGVETRYLRAWRIGNCVVRRAGGWGREGRGGEVEKGRVTAKKKIIK